MALRDQMGQQIADHIQATLARLHGTKRRHLHQALDPQQDRQALQKAPSLLHIHFNQQHQPADLNPFQQLDLILEHPQADPPPATALSSKSGSSSVSSTSKMTRKMGSSSPAMMPMRRLSGPQTPLSAGVSKLFSASKARTVPSRSMPSSRGSSPISTAFEWHQAMDTPAFCSESESLRTSLTADSYAKTSLSTPQSIKSTRGSPVGSLSGEGGRSLATQAVFSSSNQTATSSDLSRKAGSPRGTIAKSALLGISRTERQSSNRLY